MCRKPKLIQEFSTADNEKADPQISSLEGGNVPKGAVGSGIVLAAQDYPHGLT